MNYAAMTFLFNFFELGCFLWSLQTFGLKQAALIAVCVKIGRISTEVIRGKSYLVVLGVWFFGTILGVLSVHNWVLACFASPMAVFGISKIREHYKNHEKPPKKYKVVSRIVAFCLVPLFSFWILVPFVIYFLIKSVSEKCIHEEKTALFPKLGGAYQEYVLLHVHHIHYFAYAFAIPYLSIEVFHVNFLWTGIIFVVGWGAYNVYENRIASKLSYISIGHVIAGAGIGLIWAFPQAFTIMLLGWFLTGLGGGTFYMIKEKLPPGRGVSEVVELWGQLLGMIIFAISAWMNNFAIAYVFGIVFAVITTWIAISLSKEVL